MKSYLSCVIDTGLFLEIKSLICSTNKWNQYGQYALVDVRISAGGLLTLYWRDTCSLSHGNVFSLQLSASGQCLS